MSKDLKRRGFKFVGSTIMYAFMQATGMVNDHTVNCFRWKQVEGTGKRGKVPTGYRSERVLPASHGYSTIKGKTG
jgi:hypothetical protein